MSKESACTEYSEKNLIDDYDVDLAIIKAFHAGWDTAKNVDNNIISVFTDKLKKQVKK